VIVPFDTAIPYIAKRCPAIASAYAMAFGGAKQALPKDTTSPMSVRAVSSKAYMDVGHAGNAGAVSSTTDTVKTSSDFT
jgi:hypothetical protein